MKWVFLVAFAGATVLLVYAKVTAPRPNFEGVCQLVWATDENPAREEQMALFRAWHLRKYAEKIDIRTDPANRDSNKVVVQAIAGVGPDVFDTYGKASLESYVKSGIILDVTDDAVRNNYHYSRVWPAVWPSFVHEGRQYGFPDNCNAHAILYNRDMFDQAGVPHPAPGWTWDDFLKIAPKLTGRRADGQKVFALYGLNPYILLHQNGGKIFSAYGTRCIADAPQCIEALQFYVDLRDKHKVIPTKSDEASQASAGGYGGDAMNLFAARYYAMGHGGRYWFIRYTESVRQLQRFGKPSPFNIGIAELPRFAGKPTWNLAGARITGVNRNSPNLKYAVRFVEFLASEDFNRQINRSFDALPPVMDYCTGPSGIADGEKPLPGLDVANDPLWAKVMGYASEEDSSPFMSSWSTNQLWKELIGKIDAGAATPRQMLTELTTLINDEIQRNIAADGDLKARYDEALKKEGAR